MVEPGSEDGLTEGASRGKTVSGDVVEKASEPPGEECKGIARVEG